MSRTLGALLAGATIAAVGLVSAAQEPKRPEPPRIPGGLEGHITGVDRAQQSLTIVTPDGRRRTFTVTEDTTILGPRGGRVRYGLRDRRFHEGLEVTVVADGSTARAVHLGYDRGAQGQPTGEAKPAAKRAPAAGRGAEGSPSERGAPARQRGAAESGATKGAAEGEEGDEDDEIPGTITSYDPTRRLLVVALLNGASRSFLLPREVKVLVKGAPGQRGPGDPALRAGAAVTVLVEAGGRRVRELQIDPARATAPKSKKGS